MTRRREPLLPDRLRRPPPEGFSWIDRRFLRNHAPCLSRDAILLYFFLAAVSDKHGLSFFGDEKTSAILRLRVDAVVQGREELLYRDLIAHQCPYTQVLSVPSSEGHRPGSDSPRPVHELLREWLERRS